MISRAIAKYVRVSPRKVRQVIDIIRGSKVDEAFAVLLNIKKGATFYIEQVLKNALDSAIKKSEKKADASNLYISRIFADGGPMLKRYKAGTMGRAMPIRRRTSHIVVELDAIRPKVLVPAKPEEKQKGQKTKMPRKTNAKK